MTPLFHPVRKKNNIVADAIFKSYKEVNFKTASESNIKTQAIKYVSNIFQTVKLQANKLNTQTIL